MILVIILNLIYTEKNQFVQKGEEFTLSLGVTLGANLINVAESYLNNRILAAVGVLVIPLFTIPTRWAGKARWTLTREAQECNDDINGILNETMSVSGQLPVKLFGREEYEYNRYKDGVIVERGVHSELVKAGGVYTELYETQFGKALEVE